MTPLSITFHTGGPARLSRRSILHIISLLCVLASLWLFGHSAYILVKAQLAQLLLNRAFEQSITTGAPVKAWSWADTWPVARVEVSRLGASAIVLSGTSGEAMAFGPGLMNETAAIGAPGTSVIAAHRDTHFAFLKYVVAGDIITITRNDGRRFSYRVTGMEVVDWNRSGIDRHAAGFNLVLATCYPFGAMTRGPERYVVKAELVK